MTGFHKHNNRWRYEKIVKKNFDIYFQRLYIWIHKQQQTHTKMKTITFYIAMITFMIAMCIEAQDFTQIFVQAGILFVSGVLIKKTYGEVYE